MSTATPPTHRERTDAIRDAAIVCRLVGVAAMHRKLPDGKHEITHRGRTWTGDTLDEAVAAATGRAPA